MAETIEPAFEFEAETAEVEQLLVESALRTVAKSDLGAPTQRDQVMISLGVKLAVGMIMSSAPEALRHWKIPNPAER